MDRPSPDEKHVNEIISALDKTLVLITNVEEYSNIEVLLALVSEVCAAVTYMGNEYPDAREGLKYQALSMLVRELELNGPEVVTLCGSSAFRKQHEEVQARLTLEGKIVIPMGLYGHEVGIDMEGPVKKKLDELHLRKIDYSHSIFVVNPRTLTCVKCKKRCESSFHPVGATGYNNSKCCHANTTMSPYVGLSTWNEIRYAWSVGKKVYWLEEMGYE
jgi:hypothetical protein